MKQLTKIKPGSTEALNWNEWTQHYELTPQYCKNEYDNTFADDRVLEKRIKANTRVVYSFIKNNTPSCNYNTVNLILNNTEEGRRFIFDLLSSQMYADTQSGYNDLGSTPAVNVSNGQIIPREEIKRNKVSVDTEDIFNNAIDYFGFNLFSRAPFPYGLVFNLSRQFS